MPSNASALGGDDRFALVWNFEDDNYTWMDSGAVVPNTPENDLAGARCIQYGFEPGWQTRWEDAVETGIARETWEEALAALKRWTDYYEQGTEEDMYFVTPISGAYEMDQAIDNTGTGKLYFVERVSIDLDDIVPAWTTNKLKHLRQFYFHMKGSDLQGGPVEDTNSFDFSIGWSNNLMDAPVYENPVTVALRDTSVGGEYKIDFRSTGRYLAMHYDFSLSQGIDLTGGDMDAEESYGR